MLVLQVSSIPASAPPLSKASILSLSLLEWKRKKQHKEQLLCVEDHCSSPHMLHSAVCLLKIRSWPLQTPKGIPYLCPEGRSQAYGVRIHVDISWPCPPNVPSCSVPGSNVVFLWGATCFPLGIILPGLSIGVWLILYFPPLRWDTKLSWPHSRDHPGLSSSCLKDKHHHNKWEQDQYTGRKGS